MDAPPPNQARAEFLTQIQSLLQGGRGDEAVKFIEPAIKAAPGDPELNYLYAYALMQVGRASDGAQAAIRAANSAPAKSPLQADACNLVAAIFLQLRRPADAVSAANVSLAIRPDSPDTHTNLAIALALLGRRAEADSHFTKALELAPQHVQALVGHARLLRDVGRAEQAVAGLRSASQIAPRFFGVWDNLAPALNYVDGHGPAEVLAAHKQLGGFLAARPPKLPAFTFTQPKDPNRPLRVGLVSGDLREHSVAMFLEPLLRQPRPDHASLVLYSNTANPDDTTRRLRSLVPTFREIRNISDPHAANAIHADAIDVLIDLGGHTVTSRVALFRYRPAPVQITYLGYPATTGLPTIDARLVDSITDPPGSDTHCTERLFRIDPCSLCYRPAVESMPAVSSLPAERNGFVTFCSFNTVTKLGPATARAWTTILATVPGSRLLLKAIGIHDDYTRECVLDHFRAAGADLSRIEIRPYAATRAEHLAAYHDADIALDPFPYNGTATTCEALSMGVPVVSVEGATHVARVGKSLLSAVGVPELCASTVDGMIQLASDLANDRERLRHLRASLRDRVLASSLADALRFADRWYSSIRTLWKSHCAGGASV